MIPWNARAVLDLGPMTEAFGGIDDEARAAFDFFLASTHPLLVSIQAKLLADDLPGAAAAAHSAKGAANVTGAFRLGGLCAEIYEQARQGEAAGARCLAALLPDAFAEVRAAIGRLAD